MQPVARDQHYRLSASSSSFQLRVWQATDSDFQRWSTHMSNSNGGRLVTPWRINNKWETRRILFVRHRLHGVSAFTKLTLRASTYCLRLLSFSNNKQAPKQAACKQEQRQRQAIQQSVKQTNPETADQDSMQDCKQSNQHANDDIQTSAKRLSAQTEEISQYSHKQVASKQTHKSSGKMWNRKQASNFTK